MANHTVFPEDDGNSQGGAHTFPENKYDVTDHCMQTCCVLTCPFTFMPLIPGIMGSKVMTLEPEEAVLKIDCVGCHTETRRPYGELGSVDKVKYGCCVGVGSELSAKMPICPGNGCNEALVDEIVADLKRRMKARGDTGQIQRAEQMLDEVRRVGADVAEIRANVQAIMDHLKIQPQTMSRM